VSTKRRPKYAHLILRYSDKVHTVNTIEEHISVISACGYVWWGKFGRGMSQEMLGVFRDQIERDFETRAYLAKEAKIRYVTNIIDIAGATSLR